MDKPKTPRHMIHLNTQAFAALEDYKTKLEQQLGMSLSNSQAVLYLINTMKEAKEKK